MATVYTLDRGLYVNITNQCTCNCTFCLRSKTDQVGSAETLWLEHEPSKEELLEDILGYELSAFDEIVFCGYGEPTCRLEEMLWVCRELKKHSDLPLRINTNGHASFISGEDVTPLFKDLFDTVSISLNAPDAKTYVKLCRPQDGEISYYAMLDFAVKAKKYVPHVVLSVISILSENEIKACKQISKKIGVEFRIRPYQ